MDENPHPQGRIAFNPPVVYRALPYDNLLNRSGKHRDNTFFRHPKRDSDGLSVTTTIQACKAQFGRPIFGIRRVDVNGLRAYGLELFPTSETHANIRFADDTNIPTTGENDSVARNIASDLMEMSDPIEYWDADDADEIEDALLNSN